MDAEQHKETLLFVDDEENILDIASEYFEYKGFEVLTASNGREAVRVLETERVDCCFTDINMPEMDGLALCRTHPSNRQHDPGDCHDRVSLARQYHRNLEKRRR
jgi:CheY-like chemotaxis protein